jgi:phosphoserine phosphatase RsbU/P
MTSVPRNPEHELDLALAAELQSALLPKACPNNCPHQIAAARNRMCSTIGGDFHDFIRVNDEQVAMVVGDVVGHGVRSSLLMAQIMGFLRSLPPERLSRPVEVIDSLNHMLLDLGDRTAALLSCTVFYAVIDAPSGVTFFVNAGHPRPLLYANGRCTALPNGTTNLMLGVQPFTPDEDCITFESGQRLVIYTDGLPDAADPQGRRYGDSRLIDVVVTHKGSTPQQCADAIFDSVDAFRQSARQHDDETVVVIDRM